MTQQISKSDLNASFHPTNQLAVARTILANERTLMSYFRSSLGCLIGGVGFLKYFDHPVFVIGGATLLLLSAVWLIVGTKKYLMTRKLIQQIDPDDWERVIEQ